MSADLLQEAAALMRSRAEAAMSASGDPLRPDGGGWVSVPHLSRRNCNTVQTRGQKVLCYYVPDGAGEHIASWHPAVALAVADWLDEAADEFDAEVGTIWIACALAVARAYLGRQP